MDLSSTILAVSSPPGHSARGLVRCSGPVTMELLAHRLGPGSLPAERGVHVRRFRFHDTSVPVLVLVTPGPGSYSGEDSVEIQAPGHPVLLARMVETLLHDGLERGWNVQLAGPGEFTARAFLSGRIDLVEAEGVAALIAARSDDEIRAAQLMQDGRLSQMVEEVSQGLAEALALVEAGIDFTDEEDVVAIKDDDLHARVDVAVDRLTRYLDRSVGLESLQSLPWIVLDGEPNAGKSTLFNALLETTRAVVSDVSGTTRDVLAEPMRLTPHAETEVLLVDVAGDEDPRTLMEEAMQAVAAEARQRAEIRILCLPPGTPAPPPSDDLVRVGTKADQEPGSRPDVEVMVAAADGDGLDALKRVLAERLADTRSSLAGDAFVLAPRQESALVQARRRLEDTVSVLRAVSSESSAPPELVAGLLREALDALGEISGVISPEDILDRVFTTFCIGK